MESDQENSSLVKQFEQIKGQLVQIKILLVIVLILMLFVIFGLDKVLGFLGTSVVIAAVFLASGYLLLLVLERFIKWRTGPSKAEELERILLESMKVSDEEKTD